MPTKKQRRRAAKEKRHEYETVWVDAEGNELEEPPDEALEQEAKPRREDRERPQKAKTQQTRGGRPVRTPAPPSWQRAGRRALLLGGVVFALFYLSGKGSNRFVSALALAALYTALFVPFTYAIDRFAYNRWQRRQGDSKPPTKKKR